MQGRQFGVLTTWLQMPSGVFFLFTSARKGYDIRRHNRSLCTQKRAREFLPEQHTARTAKGLSCCVCIVIGHVGGLPFVAASNQALPLSCVEK